MPAESNLSIHYQFTCGDFHRLSKKRSLPDHPTLGHPECALRNPRHLERFVLGLAFTTCFGLMLGVALWSSLARHGAWVIIPLVLAGEAAVWGLVQLYRACVFRAWQNTGLFDERWVSLTTDGVVVNEPHAGVRRFPWSAIPGASVDDDHVTLALSPRPPSEWPASSVLFIPRTAFAQAEEAEAFAAFAESQRAAAKARPKALETEEHEAPLAGSLAVSYQLTKVDFARLYEHSWTFVSYRHFRRILALTLLIELVLVSLFLPPVGPGGWKEFVSFGLSLAAQYGILLWLIQWWGQRVWRRAGFFEAQSIVLTPTGVSVRCQRGGEWWLTWDEVEKTYLDAHSVVVKIPSRRIPLIVPRAAFDSGEAAEAFVSAAERWRTAWSEPENPGVMKPHGLRESSRRQSA